MPNFSTDADLLKWEPALMRDLAPDHQCLTRGTGASSQALSVVAAEGRFLTARVGKGHVIRLASAAAGIDGFYEVLSVESETELVAGLIGSGEGAARTPLPQAEGLEFSIHTFDPQHEEARWALLARFGLETDSGNAAADLERWIAQRRVFRHPSVALVLATLFRGQATGTPESSGLARKADHYARLYEEEVGRARVALDRNADGRPDDLRSGASHRLRRD